MTDWKEQLRNCIIKMEDLYKYITLSQAEYQALQMKKIQITPYMMNLILKHDMNGVLRKQFIPIHNSTHFQYCSDYLNESNFQPVPNLIHKYKNRVIIITTNNCACYCQFCTRQRVTNNAQNFCFDKQKIIDYIHANKNINDVLITGGDPLIWNTDEIVSLIDSLERIDTINIIRIGTRIPITLPMRIDDELVNALRNYNNIYISIFISIIHWN